MKLLTAFLTKANIFRIFCFLAFMVSYSIVFFAFMLTSAEPISSPTVKPTPVASIQPDVITAIPDGSQTNTPPFSGPIELDFILDGVGDNRCGIVNKNLSVAFRNILSQSKVVIPISSAGFLYLKVRVMKNCQSAFVDLRFVRMLETVVSKSPALGYTWDKQILLQSKSHMKSRLTDAVVMVAKELLSESSIPATVAPSTPQPTDTPSPDSTVDSTDSISISTAPQQFDSESDAQEHCPDDTIVWLNTRTGVYHEKGMRWYGNTRSGAYVCKGEVDNAGDRDTHNGQ